MFADNNRPDLRDGSSLNQEIQVYKKTLLALYLPAAPSSITAGSQQQQRLLSLSESASLTQFEGSVERGRLFDCRWEQSRTVEEDSIHAHIRAPAVALVRSKILLDERERGVGGRERMNVQCIHGYNICLYSLVLFYK